MSFAVVAPCRKTRPHSARHMGCTQLLLFPPPPTDTTTAPQGLVANPPKRRHRRVSSLPPMGLQPFPGRAWRPPKPTKPKPKPRPKPKKQPAQPVKQRKRYNVRMLVEGWTIDPTWIDDKACDSPHAPPMYSLKRADIKAAMATCDSCLVRLDCLANQLATHHKARASGVVAGFMFGYERNGKRIVITAPEELKGWCPMCGHTFPSGRAATIHHQRCSEQRMARILGED